VQVAYKNATAATLHGV